MTITHVHPELPPPFPPVFCYSLIAACQGLTTQTVDRTKLLNRAFRSLRERDILFKCVMRLRHREVKREREKREREERERREKKREKRKEEKRGRGTHTHTRVTGVHGMQTRHFGVHDSSATGCVARIH